ncbi:hypothetical protein THAOC_15210, partial [Thalassiosira oceanica]
MRAAPSAPRDGRVLDFSGSEGRSKSPRKTMRLRMEEGGVEISETVLVPLVALETERLMRDKYLPSTAAGDFSVCVPCVPVAVSRPNPQNAAAWDFWMAKGAGSPLFLREGSNNRGEIRFEEKEAPDLQRTRGCERIAFGFNAAPSPPLSHTTEHFARAGRNRRAKGRWIAFYIEQRSISRISKVRARQVKMDPDEEMEEYCHGDRLPHRADGDAVSGPGM